MIIYAQNITPRLNYILDLLIGDMLGLEYTITTNPKGLEALQVPVINYSDIPLQNALQIIPHGLLSETGIKEREMAPVGKYEGLLVFFETPGRDIPFDLFAAAFFLVSRYEEYLPFTPDIHGRFSSLSAYSRLQNFHHLPVVNMWVHMLGGKIKEKYPDITIIQPSFSYLSTIDIDHAWAILHKPFIRSSLSLLKSLLKLDFNTFNCKIGVLKRKRPDPYYSFDDWKVLHKGMTDRVILFFLASDATRNDMITSPRNKYWQKLVRELSGKYDSGIHPSYGSDKGEDLIKSEKRLLESITEKPVTKSRQHFVKLRFPHTYKALLSAGIREDYSMGFHDISGFRAGIAHPFKFFDLEENKATELIIFPFAVMERTLKDYMGLDSPGALSEIEKTISLVKSYGGIFISIWHNNSIGDQDEWKGWKKTYMAMNELCKNQSL